MANAWKSMAEIVLLSVSVNGGSAAIAARAIREMLDAMPDDAGGRLGFDVVAVRACASKLEAMMVSGRDEDREWIDAVMRRILDANEQADERRQAEYHRRLQENAETGGDVEPIAVGDEPGHDPGDEHDGPTGA